jgi:hypothetical protein
MLPTHTRISWVPKAIILWIKRPGLEAVHSYLVPTVRGRVEYNVSFVYLTVGLLVN